VVMGPGEEVVGSLALDAPVPVPPAMVPPPAESRAASWNAQLGVLWFAQASVMMGATFVFPFLPLMVRTVGVTDPGAVALWSGLLIAGSQLAQTGSAPLWGRVADRVGRKPMLMRSQFGLALLLALTALAPNVYYLLAMRVCVGLFAGNIATSNALVASLAPRDRLVHSLGVLQSGQYVGTMAGPALGAIFVPAFGIRPAFVVAAVLPLIGGTAMTLVVRESFQRPQRGAVRPKTRGVVRDAGVLRPLVTLLVMALLTQSVGIALATALPLRVTSLAGVAHAASAVGIAASLQAACAGAAALTVSRVVRRHSHRMVLTALPLCAAVVFALVATSSSLGELFLLVGLGGATTGAMLPSINALIGHVAPPEVRAELFGYSASASAVGGGVTPLLSGFLVARFGTPAPFLMVTVLELVLAGWAVRRLDFASSLQEARPEPVV